VEKLATNKSYNEGYRDGLSYALLLARRFCDNEDLIREIEREISPTPNENLLKLDFGKSYIIYESSNRIGMKIASKIAIDKNQLILITRDVSPDLQGLDNVKYAMISYEEADNSFNPGELSRLQEFILNNVKNKSVLYIDCMDYFVSVNTNQSNILKFISIIKDKVVKNKGILLLSLNKDAVDKTILSFLEKEIKNIIDFMKKD